MPRFTPEENKAAREHMAGASKALLGFGKLLWEDGIVDAKLKDMCRIRSAQVTGCQI